MTRELLDETIARVETEKLAIELHIAKLKALRDATPEKAEGR